MALAVRSGLNLAIGDSIVQIPQSNGVRQGSPDSPILFSRIIADDLQGALHDPPPPNPPHINPPALRGSIYG